MTWGGSHGGGAAGKGTRVIGERGLRRVQGALGKINQGGTHRVTSDGGGGGFRPEARKMTAPGAPMEEDWN